MSAIANHSTEAVAPEAEQYQALSSLAVASLAFGVFSLLALLDWSLGVVPVVGVLFGLRALSRIRRYPDEFTGALLAKAGIALSVVFLLSGWARLSYVRATEVPDGYERLSFSDLQIDKSSLRLSTSQLALDGKGVYIKGYIRSVGLPSRRDIKEFLLVRDNNTCCFGATLPNVGDMIHVKMGDLPPLDYRTSVVRMAGSLRVTPDSARQGQAVYHLDAEYCK